MFGSLGRRAVEAVVGLFALLGFAYVPLGSKTGLEHVLTLLQTKTVQEASAGLALRVMDVRARLFSALAPSALPSALPLPSSSAGSVPVRPLLPKLPNHGATTR